MAPNATIFKATLHIADMDRHYYEDHTVTLARHPSETDERMMVRLLAFAMRETAGGRRFGAAALDLAYVAELLAQEIALELPEPAESVLICKAFSDFLVEVGLRCRCRLADLLEPIFHVDNADGQGVDVIIGNLVYRRFDAFFGDFRRGFRGDLGLGFGEREGWALGIHIGCILS